MTISKQLVISVIIVFLLGASLLYVFPQDLSLTNEITTKDNQITDLQNQLTTLQNYILANSEKPAGMAGATPIAAQNAEIQNVSFIQGGLLVTANATTGIDVTITTAWIKDAAGIIVTMNTRLHSTVLPMNGTLTSIPVLVPNDTMASGYNYTVTLFSVAGDPFVSPTFVAP